MGGVGKKENPHLSWREQSVLSLPSVHYTLFFTVAGLVRATLCAFAKEPRYFPDRGIGRFGRDSRELHVTPGKIARGEACN